ncbi:MAG: UbiD family decarboxylase, partial [Rhizomicrobium sp.]
MNDKIVKGKKVPVTDLRSALEYLSTIPGQLVSTDTEVNPDAELSGVYRYVGAGGTCMRPTRRGGPAMIFNKVKGFPDYKVVTGLLGSRDRVSHLLGCPPEKLGFLIKDAVENAMPPVVVGKEKALCQEVVHLATDPDFDLRKLLPAPTNTPEDAGPYVTMGLCYASDPETGESDVTIHRLCVQSKDELSMWLTPGRHIDAFRMKAEAAGKPLPISISIGVDPAIEMAICFEPPTTPLGFDELS